MEKNVIYYCSKCNGTFGGQSGMMKNCPDCQNLLFETKTEREEWREITEMEKDYLKQRWKLETDKMKQVINRKDDINDLQSIIDINPLYEYDVVVIEEDKSGVMNVQKLRNALAKYSALGWRLKCVINDELMQDGTAIYGIETHHTIQQHILIFERLIQVAKK